MVYLHMFWSWLQDQETQEQIVGALLKKDASLLKVSVCQASLCAMALRISQMLLCLLLYFCNSLYAVQELNTKGKTPADLISHKKKLREWFQVSAQSHRH